MSMAQEITKRHCAVFTLQRDEFFHLPLWLSYYSLHFEPQDIYVIDHESTLPEVKAALENVANVKMVCNHEIYNSDWYQGVVRFQQLTLLERYEYVLYTDVDEWVIPKEGSLKDFVANADRDAYRCTGYEVIENRIYPWHDACKPIFMRVPLQLGWGCHTSVPEVPVTDDLFMYHLHRLNYDAAWAKRQRYQAHPFKDVKYREVVNEEQYKSQFYTNATHEGGAESWHPRLWLAMLQVLGTELRIPNE